MQRIMLRAKIHRATVTQCDLHYEGSCGIDENLLEAADIREFEKIELYDVNNGERFSTYAIRGKRGSGEISLNGAAARRAHLGDLSVQLRESILHAVQPGIGLFGCGAGIHQILLDG